MRRLGVLKTKFEAGQLQTVDDDVLNIVRRVKEIDQRLDVYYDDAQDRFVFTETSLDGSTERLVFFADELDERCLDRLRAADHWHGNTTPEHVLGDDEDYLTDVEKAQARIDAAKDEQMKGERIEILDEVASYADLDGKGTRATILVPRGI